MPPPITRRALLLSAALLATPAAAPAQSAVIELDATVLAAYSPGMQCGHLAIAGWATVRPTRVISGSLAPGDVRLVIGCGNTRVGQHVHVRAIPISPHATRFGIYMLVRPLPRDGLVTLGVRSLTLLP